MMIMCICIIYSYWFYFLWDMCLWFLIDKLMLVFVDCIVGYWLCWNEYLIGDVWWCFILCIYLGLFVFIYEIDEYFVFCFYNLIYINFVWMWCITLNGVFEFWMCFNVYDLNIMYVCKMYVK